MSRAANILQRASAAAAYGNPCAQARLGYAYTHAQGGLAKDHAAALKWYKKAAEQGHAISMNNIGTLFAIGGHGVTQNVATAAEWFRMSAEAGFGAGQQRSGLTTPMDFPSTQYNNPAAWADFLAGDADDGLEMVA